MGFEPMNNGFANHRLSPLKDCNDKYLNHSEISTPPAAPPELQAIIDKWPQLPTHIKLAIQSLLEVE